MEHPSVSANLRRIALAERVCNNMITNWFKNNPNGDTTKFMLTDRQFIKAYSMLQVCRNGDYITPS